MRQWLVLCVIWDLALSIIYEHLAMWSQWPLLVMTTMCRCLAMLIATPRFRGAVKGGVFSNSNQLHGVNPLQKPSQRASKNKTMRKSVEKKRPRKKRRKETPLRSGGKKYHSAPSRRLYSAVSLNSQGASTMSRYPTQQQYSDIFVSMKRKLLQLYCNVNLIYVLNLVCLE